MKSNAVAELEADATTAKRAQWEAFEFDLEAPGLVRVRNGSYGADAEEHTYRVNVEDGVPTACECPADTYGDGACKHRLAVAIRAPVLAAASEWDREQDVDGDAEERAVATDGGTILEDGDGDADREEERPADCACDPAVDLPCWPCYRDGHETPNPDADADAEAGEE